MKECSKCKKTKDAGCFYKYRSGLRGVCKLCMSEMAKKRHASKAQKVGYNQKNLKLPSMEYLRSLFEYHEDGYFIRKTHRGSQKAGSVVKGKTEKSGYKRMPISHNLYLTHRLIWMWHNGTEPEAIDHIDHDRLNNRIENLRPASKNENARHQVLPVNNTSGYYGVSWNGLMKGGSWSANVCVNSKLISLGYYHNKKDAVMAYNDATMKLHGEFGKDKVKHNLEQLKKESKTND